MTDSWWVYDRPLMRDVIFAASLLCGAAAAVVGIAGMENPSALGALYNVLGGAVAGFFFAGVVGGSVRNFIRGYRGGSSP
ncbi:hypothetical protein [Egicoccus halophilus]|uniref:Uncharacterized protein n=1 Tax=Egicoccus halophilus TaxID=1670830 RepID=A0A8J3ESH3_9ACTN|nr:hypothetical protein [Egicoccus halophilus]GGI07423.1 hypothetical protein GCM10011354_24010 [Egicoccus halophilus]